MEKTRYGYLCDTCWQFHPTDKHPESKLSATDVSSSLPTGNEDPIGAET